MSASNSPLVSGRPPNEPKRFRRGLVVGKFSPLHRGHQLLIEQALACCDEVAIISYSQPEFARCGAVARRRWLAELFPQTRRLVLDQSDLAACCVERGWPPRTMPHNDAPDDHHRRFCAWLCHDVLVFQPDAVFTSEDYGDGFAAALADYFSAATGRRQEVVHVNVDQPRHRVPVSGTRLRAAPHAGRDFMPPPIYADFVERICLLGGEASGKTTLAAALASQLKTNWVPEYGRQRWLEQDGQLAYPDMLAIGRRQLADEDRLAASATRWLFCDTSPLTTVFYSAAMFDRVDQELAQLAERRYDRIYLCAPDFAFVQDGTRRDETFRQRQHDWYRAELARRGWSYELLSGSLAQRMARVIAGLGG